MSWGTEQGDKSFRDAIAAIEDNSAVECVVAVRAYARRWMAAHVVVGLVAAYAVLIYTVIVRAPALGRARVPARRAASCRR